MKVKWSDLSLFYKRDNGAYNVLERKRFLLRGAFVRISLSPPSRPNSYTQVARDHWKTPKKTLRSTPVEYGAIGFDCSIYVLDQKNRLSDSSLIGDSSRTGLESQFYTRVPASAKPPRRSVMMSNGSVRVGSERAHLPFRNIDSGSQRERGQHG